MEDNLTLCPACRHYLSIEDGSRTGIWYNLYCTATKRTPTIDPTTGRKAYKGTNDLGKNYLTDEEYYHCRDINDGHCKYFEEDGVKNSIKELVPSEVFNRLKKFLGEE